MEIPYTVSNRPDTGLWNAKIGIWLFLASEVMLFGGLFSAYIFLRIDAAPGTWPHGLLNVPVGTMNTAILITSSFTMSRSRSRFLAADVFKSSLPWPARYAFVVFGCQIQCGFECAVYPINRCGLESLRRQVVAEFAQIVR